MDSMKEVYDGIKKLITITERIEGHTKDIAEIKGEVTAIKENVTENTRDIAEIKVNVGGIERRLDSMEQRLDSLDTAQKVISVDIHAIKDKLEVKEEIYALKERLSSVEAAIGKT